ncbi:Predicted arabinose efflux permease, MFS family [Nocardioides terrae]|uniref:Predicted arabinose efflux permease, MFS family n=1 Tax=Nocardioides terrae TaxID=574651 RepID=A0A1I1P515_9ACTN|nr:MFS transporter [Nocardioides terrae]SFD04692.1 Predicted arabinose efflux permease, MFS family [Nocardioides terrae]
MQDLVSASILASTDRPRRLAFASAVLALVTSFAANAAPVPLYNVYRAEDGLTNAQISMAVVAYSLGTIASLLVLGRVSNHVGRRPAALVSLILTMAGCLVLLNVHHVAPLLVGRLSMGLGAGLASSSLTAYIVDTAPVKPRWLASVASSQGPMFGLALGAIGSGVLVQLAPWPRDLVYVSLAVALLASAGLIGLSPETVPATSGVRRSMRPQVRLPHHAKPLVGVAAAVFVATWATGAFYQAFVPALIEDQLHTGSPLVLGMVFAAYMASSALGAPLGGTFTPATGQRVGMGVFLVGMIGLIAAISTGTLALFIAATVVAGASQGIAISAAVRGLLAGSTVSDRAPIFSVIYLISYSGAAFPSLVAGQFSHAISVPHIAFAYGGLALLATSYTVVAARDPQER